MMSYEDALKFLNEQLPSYEKSGVGAYAPGTDKMRNLLEKFANPQQSYMSVHIAGTNGKGSVANMLYRICLASGYKAGIFTSPSILDIREMIEANGSRVSENYISEFVEEHQQLLLDYHCTFFETMSLIAFNWFKVIKVDILLIEAGMGGESDCTNVIIPNVSIITSVSLDHTEILGNTIEKIAKEKSGIIKENIPVVLGKMDKTAENIFLEQACEKKCPVWYSGRVYSFKRNKEYPKQFEAYQYNQLIYKNLELNDLPSYQFENLAVALTTIEVLGLKDLFFRTELVEKGVNRIGNIGIAGRWQTVTGSPKLIVDVAHNQAGLEKVFEEIQSTNFKNLFLVVAMTNNKRPQDFFELFLNYKKLINRTNLYFTQFKSARSIKATDFSKKSSFYSLTSLSFENVSEAVHTALSNADIDDLIVVTGSHYLISETLEFFDVMFKNFNAQF